MPAISRLVLHAFITDSHEKIIIFQKLLEMVRMILKFMEFSLSIAQCQAQSKTFPVKIQTIFAMAIFQFLSYDLSVSEDTGERTVCQASESY